jgi:hypothetical protein
MIYMVHKYMGWSKQFGSADLLLQYLNEHQVTRRQLYDYYIIEGLGAWQQIAKDLPTGPEPGPEAGDPIETGRF